MIDGISYMSVTKSQPVLLQVVYGKDFKGYNSVLNVRFCPVFIMFIELQMHSSTNY